MQRKVYIQILGVISSLAVVMMHVNGCFWSFSYERYWITANVIECMCYFAVPVFFMISGATLIDYRSRYSTKVFLKKRFVKTVIPFLIWSIIGMIWCYFVKGISMTSIRDIIDAIGTSRFVDIYWFFPPLFSVYLAIPVLSCIPEKMRKKVFGYAIAVAFFAQSFLPLIFNLLQLQYNYSFEMPVVGGYLLYTLLGYWLSHYELNKNVRIGVYILAVAGFSVQLFGTQVLSLKAGEIITIFKDYKNVPCILYAAGVFLFFKNMKNKKVLNLLDRITAPFSKMTFGIYLIHWFVIQTVTQNIDFPVTSIKYRIFGAIGIFLISAIIIKILQQIPIVKRAIPS